MEVSVVVVVGGCCWREKVTIWFVMGFLAGITVYLRLRPLGFGS